MLIGKSTSQRTKVLVCMIPFNRRFVHARTVGLHKPFAGLKLEVLVRTHDVYNGLQISIPLCNHKGSHSH